MIDRISWQQAFKQGDAPTVVRTLCAAWRTLVETSPDTFHSREQEPQLTELLCEYLRQTKYESKLTGNWSYEVRQGNLKWVSAKGLRVSDRKRTDIQYFSNRENPPLDLIFEFKKLSSSKTRRDKYCGEDGMLRFITGEYSKGQPLAVMVGILLDPPAASLPPLAKWLDGPKARAALHLEAIDSRHRHQPSRFFPAESPYDTEHLRPSDRAPAHGTIVISHIFLEMPCTISTAPKPRRKKSTPDVSSETAAKCELSDA